MKSIRCAECAEKLRTNINPYHGPSIGICGHSGATYETILSVLHGWSVTVTIRGGRTFTGMVQAQEGDLMRLYDWYDPEPALICTIPMEDIVHIQIT